MACRLVSAKPLSEPMLQFGELDPSEKKLINFKRNSNIFTEEKALENFVCEMASTLCRP